MAEIQADAHMNNLLSGKPNVVRAGTRKVIFFEDVELPPFNMKIRIPREIDEPYNYPTPARVVNSRVVRVVSLNFDQTRVTELPQSGLLTRKTIQNCADVTATSSIGLSVTGTQSWSVTKTEGVSTTQGASLTGSVGVPGVGGGSVTLNFSQTFSASTAVMDGGSQQVTRTSNETITVGPRRAVEIELLAYQCSAEIPFSATVIVDGDLEPNLSGVSLASQILGEAERTLPVLGVLRLADVSQANLRTRDLGGAQGCDSQAGTRIVEERLPPLPAAGSPAGSSSGFSLVSAIARTSHNTLDISAGHFASHVWRLGDEDGPTIGPPDGTNYEVLYTTEAYEPSAACGFNDLGVMNLGIFDVEARQYRTYANGQLVSQWQELVKTFKGCQPV